MKIAIIEDSATIVTVWKKFLQECAYQYRFFDSRLESVEALSAFCPDFVLCPGVPRYNSLDTVISELHKNKRSVFVFILCTSLEEEEIQNNCDLEMIDAVLVKPFTKDKVQTILEEFSTQLTLSKRKTPVCLIIDDSKAACSVLSYEMKNLGFEVKTTDHVDRGLEIACRILPDIILVDIEMPDKNGWDFCAELTTIPATRRLPVILISASMDETELRCSFQAGIVDFLTKPVDSYQLMHAIDNIVGKKEIARKGRVLILNDASTSASIIIKLFDEMGILCSHCSNMTEFQAYLAVSLPDMILISLSKDQKQGAELCKSLRKNLALTHIPIAIIADSEQRRNMVHCLQNGANDFIQKPFTKEEFQARIDNLLKIKKLQDELLQKNRALRNLAYQDPLTELLNRRYLDEGLKKEIERSKRTKEAISVLMIDLDYFKKVNDMYGHKIGDFVLQEISQIIRRGIRSMDIACRYGGEELCVILPACSLNHAAKIAERIRIHCSSAKFTSYAIEQTLSIGVTSYPNPSTAKNLLNDADKALYRAKRNGRNQIKLFEING